MDIEQIKRDAFAAGWLACLQALRESMQEKSAPHFPPADPPVLPREDSCPWFTLQVVKQQPGMNTGVLVQHTRDSSGGAFSENAIRVAISRLKAKNLIVARDNKWFPV